MASFNYQMLRQVRLDLGLTQEGAATALGMDVRTYRRYESGAVNRGGSFSIRHSSRRQILRSMCEQFGVQHESEWLRDEPPGLSVGAPAAVPATAFAPCLTHPLTAARHFIGRQELLARLCRWYADPTSAERVIAIVAVGGTGKTALVERFLRERGHDPGGVLVWSFYEDPRASALLDKALAYFGTSAPSASGGQADRLLDALRAGPLHLLVLDGLEAIQSAGGAGRTLGEVEDPALRRILRAVAAGLVRCRVLATSRFALSDLAPWESQGLCSLHLPDLTDHEALDLLRGYGVRGDTKTVRRLLQRVGRHALSVAMAGSYAGEFFGGSPAAAITALGPTLAELDEPLARRLRSILTAYTQALSEPERDLLCRLAVLPQGAPLALVASMAAAPHVAGSLLGLDESKLLQLLRRLGRLGLVSPGPMHALHPFVRDHFRALLGVPASAIHELARERVAADLAGRPGPAVSGPEMLDRYEALLEHTLHAGRPLEAWSIYASVLGGYGLLGLQCGELVRGARVLRLLCGEYSSAGTGDSPPPLPRGIHAQVAYDLGLYESALGDLSSAERHYRSSAALATAAGGRFERSLAMVHRTLGYNAWLRGELADAAQWVEQSRAEAHAEGDRHALVRSLALAGAIAQDRGQVELAAERFAEAQELESKDLAARRGLWLAEHLMARGQWDQAQALVHRDVTSCAQLGWAGLVAHGHTLLGHILLTQTEPASAEPHLLQAQHWARRSGEVELVLRCHVLAARLALAQRDAESAQREAEEGLSLARPCGFGLFAVRLLQGLAAAQLARGARAEAVASAREALARATAAGYASGRREAEALLAGVPSP